MEPHLLRHRPDRVGGSLPRIISLVVQRPIGQCSGAMVAGNSAVYAISKAAIMPFTHSLALQSTDMSIRVNAVLP
mgnify:CR=1 FL=1